MDEQHFKIQKNLSGKSEFGYTMNLVGADRLARIFTKIIHKNSRQFFENASIAIQISNLQKQEAKKMQLLNRQKEKLATKVKKQFLKRMIEGNRSSLLKSAFEILQENAKLYQAQQFNKNNRLKPCFSAIKNEQTAKETKTFLKEFVREKIMAMVQKRQKKCFVRWKEQCQPQITVVVQQIQPQKSYSPRKPQTFVADKSILPKVVSRLFFRRKKSYFSTLASIFQLETHILQANNRTIVLYHQMLEKNLKLKVMKSLKWKPDISKFAKFLTKKYISNMKISFNKIKIVRNNYYSDPKLTCSKDSKVAKAKIDLSKSTQKKNFMSPLKSKVNPVPLNLTTNKKKPVQSNIKSSQKQKKSPIRDPSTKRDIEIMQQKIQQMACQTLISRVEYCLENLQMRAAIQKVKKFANYERQIEAVEYMYQIQIKRQLLESLVQWVKVVYANELKSQIPTRASQDLMELNQKVFNKNLLCPDYDEILNSYQSNPSSSAINPMATMNTVKQRHLEDDDCFMDDVGNEGVNLVGVASSHNSEEEFYTGETPVEQIKIDEESIRKSKETFNFKKSNQMQKARSRYNDDDDQVHMDTEEEVYSKPNLHLGQLIFNNHNFVQNINMFPQTSRDYDNTDSIISGKQVLSERSDNVSHPYSGRNKKPINASQGYLQKVAQRNVYNQLKSSQSKYSPVNQSNSKMKFK